MLQEEHNKLQVTKGISIESLEHQKFLVFLIIIKNGDDFLDLK